MPGIMAARSNEGAMDYDWQNGTGPIDPSSPWMNAQKKNTFFGQHPKRSRSDFESSPSKSISTANIPALRPAAGQTTLFSRPKTSPDKPLPPAPSKTIDIAAFRTPSRAPAFDFTSGDDTPEESHLRHGPGGFHAGETPDADSEATPEQIQQRTHRARMMSSPSKTVSEDKRDRTRSPKKRTSLFTRIWNSPSRSKELMKPYSNKVEKRVQRRRAEKSWTRNAKSSAYESDSEQESRRINDGRTNQSSGTFHGWMTSWLGLVENHPNAPRILITYLQLLTNFLFMCVILYLGWSFWMTIKRDVDQSVHEAASEVIIQVRQCKDDWEQFRCEARPERTRELCEGLAKCLARNPEQIARAQVSAKTFARIMNDFAENLSFKAVLVYVISFSSMWWVSNATWNSLRHRLSPTDQMHQHHHNSGAWFASQALPPPPATPSRHASGGALPPPYGTPYHHNPYFGAYPGLQMGAGETQQQQQQQHQAGTSPEKTLIDFT